VSEADEVRVKVNMDGNQMSISLGRRLRRLP
jgi:hypothetical protein